MNISLKNIINKLVLFRIVWIQNQLPRLCVHTRGASFDALAHAGEDDAHDEARDAHAF